MRIVEFAETPEEHNDLPFSVVDDAVVFMRNDPKFYRQDYYPAMTKIADLHRAGKKIDHIGMLSPMVEKGITDYCRKFKLADMPDEIFNQDDRDRLIDLVFSEELENIKKGDYK